jgi:hypothetical protein
MTHKKGQEKYRRLAGKCRETARVVSAENGRAELLAMAAVWDLIVKRLEMRPLPVPDTVAGPRRVMRFRQPWSISHRDWNATKMVAPRGKKN